MTRRYRSFFRVPLLAAFGFVGALPLMGAQDAQAQTAQQSRWSDPATWPNHKVPVAGDKVTIGRDKDVILDVSPPALDGLSID
ncbi:MAG TPA: G8 domain-containing protein, partial [Steroidobacteraceae bacterium]|nr:G8 domain-containing protein [Steroidobacteraceae bacterium]